MGNPAVSVIIPLYNAEQYLGECLVSLLAQTFQDFEVIVVDDCSTDNSVAIVESYESKFGGRMTLAHMDKNSGSCAMPRNKALSLARGEYIQFLDADDTLTTTALEELYTLAKDYDADVVYCEKYYMSEGRGDDFVKNIHPADSRIQKPPFVDEPTFETDDLAERVQEILKGRFWVTAWNKFIKRDLITEHGIFFPYICPSEDDIWTYGLVCHAKKFLRVPNMTYIRRMRENSTMGTQRTPQQTLNFWLNPVLFGLKSLDDILSRKKFFQENPQQRYAVLERFANGKFGLAMRAVEKFSSTEICDMIKAEYGARFGEYSVLIPLLCTLLGQDRKKLRDNTNKLKRLDALKKSAAADKKRIVELETVATEFDALKKSAAADKKRIAELETVATEFDALKKSAVADKKRIVELETVATEFDALKKSAAADKKRIAELETVATEFDALKKSTAADKKRIAELETVATEFDALKKSAVADKKRIAELERELKMLKSYMNVLRGE